jgi:predicted ATPase
MHRHGEAITLARRLQDPPSLAHSTFLSCASTQSPGGNAAAVFAAAKELWELSAQLGFSQFQACAQMFLGWALARSGEALQGIAQMSEGLGILQPIGASMFMPRAGCLMADAHLMAHRYREGLGHVAQALHFTETGDQSCLARLYHLRAELLLHLHGTGDAAVEASLRQAIAVARRQEAKGWELPATTSLARLWVDCGRRREARDLLAPIYGWFTEGFDTPDLQTARALLDALR